MYKDKTKAQEYQIRWREKNKEKIAKRNKEYRALHREKLLEYQKKHYRENKEMYRKTMKQWRASNKRRYKKCLESWADVIPSETLCGVCGKKIYFNISDVRKAIHFDHRHANTEPIQGSPAIFLRNSMKTAEKEKMWKESDFGMLCERCNRSLPTLGRKQFLLNALKYVNSYNGT